MTAVGESGIVKKVVRISSDLFPYLVVGFIIILLTEALWEDSISSLLPSSYLLVLLVGMIVASLSAAYVMETIPPETPTRKSLLLAAVPGLLIATIVWYKLPDLGPWSLIVAGTSGTLVILLSVLGSTEEET